MAINGPSKYPLRIAPSKQRSIYYIQAFALVCVIGLTGVFLIPQIITTQVLYEQNQTVAATPSAASTTLAVNAPFPVSVDPATKTIVVNPRANALFQDSDTNLTASADLVSYVFSWIASLIDNTNLYQSMAAADGHLIVIKPGYRKEEILQELSEDLGWNNSQQQEFLADVTANTPGITDGMFAPGSYVIYDNMTPSNVAALMNLQFDRTILNHYSSTTAQYVPLPEALTVASLIEREASGNGDMRLISGIIWNRLFNNMNLQIDASLQYAMGENKQGVWWQNVLPKDKYINSPYNTYEHTGLPPGPIANPSVAAVLAALNPVPTKCLYYFHDANGNFHCSDTYAEHVALLKKYYGQGK